MKLDYTIIDAIDSVCIYWKDLKGRILGCNKYLYQMAGLLERGDVIGKTGTVKLMCVTKRSY